MSRSVSLGFIRNTVRERLISVLAGSKYGFRYIATESPAGDDVRVIDTTPITRVLPEPTTQLSGHRPTMQKSVLVLTGAVVDTITNYVYDRDLRFIGESSSWSLDHSVLRAPARPRPPRTVTYPVESLYLGTDAYYHWLIEEVPAYLQARRASPEARTIIRRSPPRYVVDLLQLIDEQYSEAPTYARLELLTFASKGAAIIPNEVDLQTLHDLRDSLELRTGQPRRFYVSRRDSGRYPANEDAVEAVVAQAGCEIVQLAGMSLPDQIALFAGAELVVGTHGAGLANLAWCRTAATRVVEIARTGQPNCFATLAELSALPYAVVTSAPQGAWTVDVDSLKRAIDPAVR